MFEAKVIEHSRARHGAELITLQLRYPRFIHAEAKTHRIISNSGEEYETVILTQDASFMSDTNLSRNASSSRAIPVAKMIDQVRHDPAMPVHWGKNQPGMQARAELTGAELMATKQAWRDAAAAAADLAQIMTDAGAHKQVANRILEPFQWINVIVTATEWDNFFDLRDHPDADPNIQWLAQLMRGAMDASTPRLLGDDPIFTDAWHLPYISQAEREHYPQEPELLARASSARCARVSYNNHDGTAPDMVKDLDLHEKLVGSKPLHASPVEHQGYPADRASTQSGNFRGFIQFRKDLGA